jgi:hypothetical protein
VKKEEPFVNTQHNTSGITTVNQPASAANPALSDESVLTLLDNAGLGFAKHTHHPGSHITYGDGLPADPWVADPSLNMRQQCFIPPDLGMSAGD